ncbi:ABC transporter substrate-binding protein [Rhodopseudomonas pseudopalustris]|uniref:NitT/TauT family transport system substrate-binding protein n=1 Tax=Rhodopseudomonas pseudopalustris TaxID=1513892 RepID=A0A1H8PI53_9BRAD|nr:ABC transporter substrate-binding protein [Rhodopseudomonas pseudopalustris]SEO41496.1 NitT/TauT family transport system substrate-binding protein [Rhodopseudomonas pseudopalustris]
MTAPISRRRVLAAAGACAALPLWPNHASAAALREIVLTGPPAGPSITLAHAVATGAVSFLADKTTFRAWRDPDEMRAGLTSGTMPLVIMPTAAAANLYNRGLGIRLVNVMTHGLLYVIAADPSLSSFPALKGKRLAVPFRNDTPEFLSNILLRSHGMEAGRDLQVSSTGSPIEAIQLLLAGRIDAALVPEPAATAAILRGKIAGQVIHRVMDVQAEWAKVAGGSSILPQAGLAVTTAFQAANPALVTQLHEALVKATAEVNAAPAVAAGHSAAYFELPLPIIQQAIPHSNLVCVAARDARADLEHMFTSAAGADLAMLGGRLPDKDFYL